MACELRRVNAFCEKVMKGVQATPQDSIGGNHCPKCAQVGKGRPEARLVIA